jgi:hypothetical protein
MAKRPAKMVAPKAPSPMIDGGFDAAMIELLRGKGPPEFELKLTDRKIGFYAVATKKDPRRRTPSDIVLVLMIEERDTELVLLATFEMVREQWVAFKQIVDLSYRPIAKPRRKRL